MADVRDVLADDAREVLFFLGIVLMFFGGAVHDIVSVVGFVTIVAAIFVGGTIERLLLELSGDESEQRADSPLEELRERYARGDIDHDEFERRVERLVETEGVAAARNDLEVEAHRERELEGR